MTKTLSIQNVKSRYIKLNVGGSLYQTTLSTLSNGDTMLKAMFSGRLDVVKDRHDYYLIDRDGKYFGYILNYLRLDSFDLEISYLMPASFWPSLAF